MRAPTKCIAIGDNGEQFEGIDNHFQWARTWAIEEAINAGYHGNLMLYISEVNYWDGQWGKKRYIQSMTEEIWMQCYDEMTNFSQKTPRFGVNIV